MARVSQEACELFLEQEIDNALGKGKTPYSIGQELAAWLEKMFEAKMKPHTIEMRAHRRQAELTNVSSGPTAQNDDENAENQEIKTHGGKREGAGRKPKFARVPANRARV